MAVKHHKVIHDNKGPVDISLLAQYIQLLNEQPAYLPTPVELVKYCKDVVRCLALSQIPRESDKLNVFLDQLRQVEEFLQELIRNVSPDLRKEIISTVLKTLYVIISHPQSEACPAASIVLSLIQEGQNIDTIDFAVHWLVQEAESSSKPASEGLRAALGCLYRWLFSWQCTPVLSEWVLAFIKGLEKKKRFDVLMDVSLEYIERLYEAMLAPTVIRQAVAPVVFHILASMRTTFEVIDKIAAKTIVILESLASDSSQMSRQLLQTLVDIISETIAELHKHPSDFEANKDKYSALTACLDTHMTSKSCRALSVKPWSKPFNYLNQANSTAKKVGLVNTGNTCYMNSVIQALLMTRPFSTHVMVKMSTVPYFSKMSHLFALMMYAVCSRLDPTEFCTVVKPPHFVDNHQHDSSEFLCHLLELLHNQERNGRRLMDKPAPESSQAVKMSATSAGLEPDEGEPECKRERSSSPKASCANNRRSCSPLALAPSTAGPAPIIGYNIEDEDDMPLVKIEPTSSSSLKRKLEIDDSLPPVTKRRSPRYHNVDLVLSRKETFIQNLFSGTLLTRIKCVICNSCSIQHDMFRDLQLAFPEKPIIGDYTVQVLLDYYCSTERLSGENRYLCNNCGCLRDAERSVLIESPPKFLILVLKNFKYNPKLHVRTKLIHTVLHDKTISLPVTRSHEQQSAYDLYAAIIHRGTNLDSGHYYTIAKEKEQWFKFNDEVVEATTESELNNLTKYSTPYILFYRRTDVEECDGPSLDELPQSIVDAVSAQNKQFMESIKKPRLHNTRLST